MKSFTDSKQMRREVRLLTIIVVLASMMVVFTLVAVAQPLYTNQSQGSQQPWLVLHSILEDLSPSSVISSELNCRLGFTGVDNDLSESFGGGTYLTFGTGAPNGPMEDIQMFTVHQKKSGFTYLPDYTISPPLSETGYLATLLASNPGALWIIGNEPDRGPNAGQSTGGGDTYPEIYARAYHDAYQFIKAHDPTAQVAVAGLVEVTPGRTQYLDKVWNTYLALYSTTMPVDVWNMHLYVLPETDGIANVALGTSPTLAIGYGVTHTASGQDNFFTWGDHDNLNQFNIQVRRMRQWMKDHGQQNRPLLLGEFGILMDETVTDEFGKNFTAARAATFLSRTFNYLANTTVPTLGMPIDNYHLVQQWYWFSLNNGNNGLGHVSNLITYTVPATYTIVGKAFRAFASTQPLTTNLYLRSFSASTLLPKGESSVTATVSVDIFNRGNQLMYLGPVTLTFYADQSQTQVITSVVVNGVPGCARRGVKVETQWTNLTAGYHSYWVNMNGGGTQILGTGQVYVMASEIYLPILRRNS